MKEVKEELEYTLQQLQVAYSLTDDEVNLIRTLCLYETDLKEIEGVMSEFEYHKLTRGFKRNWSKGSLLEYIRYLNAPL